MGVRVAVMPAAVETESGSVWLLVVWHVARGAEQMIRFEKVTISLLSALIVTHYTADGG